MRWALWYARTAFLYEGELCKIRRPTMETVAAAMASEGRKVAIVDHEIRPTALRIRLLLLGRKGTLSGGVW